MKTAKFIKKMEKFRGDANLYELSEEVEYGDDDDNMEKTKFVIVSAANAAYSGPETYIFAADAEGTILDWTEMQGSFRGSFNHAVALTGLGFKITQEEQPSYDKDTKAAYQKKAR